MTSLLLPPEVFDNVISLLKYDIASLKAVSLTCKQWLLFARPLLYKSIIVTIREPQPFTQGGTANAVNFYCLPEYNSKYTTHLTIRSSPHIMLSFNPSISLCLPLDQLSNLHTLTLTRVHLAQLDSIPRPDAIARRITTLRIHRLYYVVPCDLTKLILAFPSVRCLSVHPIQDGVRLRPAFYELGETSPPPHIPPIQCFNARMDLACGFPGGFINVMRHTRHVHRLSLVISFANEAENIFLSELFQDVGLVIPVWDLGLKFAPNRRKIDPNGLLFSTLEDLQSLTLSLLDFGTTLKHTLSYVVAQHMFNSFLIPPTQSLQEKSTRQAPSSRSFPDFRRLTLSFECPSTSRRDIKRTFAINSETDAGVGATPDLNILDLEKDDIQDACDWAIQDRRTYFQPYDSGLRNVWSLCDSSTARSVKEFPNIREIVVEVRALTRARFVGKWDELSPRLDFGIGDASIRPVDGGRSSGDADSDLDFEMGVGELNVLAMSLLPQCMDRGITIRAKMGMVARVSGIWEDHECPS